MITKIEIKSIFGNVLFSHECEDNTVKKTVVEAVKSGADLRCANLRCANLRDADLSDADLSGADLSSANLSGADLSSAYLSGANLSGADLGDADLRCANLRCANLRDADLSDADLRGADLSDANLSGADLDFSCLHFSCKSRKPKTDERQRVQLCHHLLSWIKYSDNATDFEKELFNFAREYANKFHRTDVERFEPIKISNNE